MKAQKLVDKLLTEASRQDMRFDVNARVEIWIEADDIESSRNYKKIVNSGKSKDQIIAELKAVAVQLAWEKLSEVEGIRVTAGINISDVNVNRIDWHTLAMSDQEREEQDRADEPWLP